VLSAQEGEAVLHDKIQIYDHGDEYVVMVDVSNTLTHSLFFSLSLLLRFLPFFLFFTSLICFFFVTFVSFSR
jgi:membrane-anchored protein YejM (alkaline phosphatase superfamily)